jgi:hypothetical protein
VFAQEDLARMRPADQVAVRACGQGWRPPGFPPGAAVLNLDPAVLSVLPVVLADGGPVTAGVRTILPSKVSGNGIGRPSAGWDLDLQIRAGLGAADLLLGDLVAVSGLDARYNMGYRAGWLTVGLVVHGASPLPGHGPGITPILTGPASAVRAEPDEAGHTGLTEAALQQLTTARLEVQ